MGRTAAYTGQVITPDMILNSKEDLAPQVTSSVRSRCVRFRCPVPASSPEAPAAPSIWSEWVEEPIPRWDWSSGTPVARLVPSGLKVSYNRVTASFRRSWRTLASGSTTIRSGSNGHSITTSRELPLLRMTVFRASL